MKILFISIGKWGFKDLEKLALDYEKRLKKYLPFESKIVKNLAALEEIIEDSDHLILLDERGPQMTSVDFSKWIQKQQMSSTKKLIFVVGPAEGFGKTWLSRAQATFSLSKMTLQHEMAHLIFFGTTLSGFHNH